MSHSSDFRNASLSSTAKVVIGKGKYLKRMMTHAKGRAGRVTHPFHHLSVYVRPTKAAIKEAAAEAKKGAVKVEPTATTPSPIDAAPVEPISSSANKKGGWWPFGKKQEASL